MNPEKPNQGSSSSLQIARRLICSRPTSEERTESSGSVDSTILSVDSPVTNLTFNLQVLSTRGQKTKVARRKLSLSSSSSSSSFNGSSDAASLPLLQRQVSADDGCYVDSPDSEDSRDLGATYDSPFLENWMPPAKQKPSFKRFNSVPVLISPTASSGLPSVFSLTSVKEVDFVHCVENGQDLSRDENKENDCTAGVSDGKKSVSFKLPTSPAPRGILSPFKDETNILPLRRRSSYQGNSSHQSNQDPVYKSPMTPAKAYSRPPQRTLSRRLSNDDGFLEKLQGEEELVDGLTVPKGLEGLFFSPVIEGNENDTPAVEMKCDGGGQENVVPSLVRGLFHSPSAPKLIRRKYSAQDIRVSYKRSESQTQDSDLTPLQLKRWKGLTKENKTAAERREDDKERCLNPRRIMRCHSETEIFIKTALSWADSQQDLIGDFTKPFCLPLISGKHQDLKAISPETMAAIVNESYKDMVENCIVIDCRYPYEFHGGHIKGARNIYTSEELVNIFFANKEASASSHILSSSASLEKRTVVVFHCEFSSERGPKLSRFLRNHDRDANINSYPLLHYPELYLLEGGYKTFYESFPHLCHPQGYVPMLHEDHLAELKMYRSKANSWGIMEKARVTGRSTAARPSLNL